jgi:hypothetical protein
MHTRDLIKKGVKVEKLALVQACKEGGSLFSEIERAALAWAESVGGSLRPACQIAPTKPRATYSMRSISSTSRSRSAW